MVRNTRAWLVVVRVAAAAGVFVCASAAVAQLPVGCPFFPVAPIAVGLGPQGIASGDFDNDGDNDLVVANTLDNTLQILRNNGEGAFVADGTLLNSFGQPIAVAVGALNGDSFPDIAVANLLGDSVTVFLNNGAGGFGAAPSQTIAVGDGPTAIALGTFDAGLSLDIVTANFNAGNVSLSKNNGAGVFGAAAAFVAGVGPSSIAVDPGGDRIYVALRGQDALAALFETAGGFGAPTVYNVFPPGSEPVSIALAHLNADGFIDLVSANAGTESVSILPGQAEIVRGGALPPFGAAVNVSVPGGPRAVALGVLDLGASIDIAVAAYDNSTATILRNNGVGGFSAASSETYSTELGPQALALVDLDGDTDLDLAAANTDDASVSVIRNKLPAIGGGFATFTIYESGIEPRAVAFGDLNGDSMPDLVAVNFGSDDLSVFINAGGGRYMAEERYTAGVDPRDAVVADISGDGRPDLIVANRQSDNISVLINNGSNAVNARFAAQAVYAAGDGPIALAVGNVNGAGLPDIVAANDNGGGISRLFNMGGGVFALQSPIPASGSQQDIALGDVDFDLDQDIVVVSRAADLATVFLNNGSGAFTMGDTTGTGDEPVSLALTSLDFSIARSAPDLDIAVACHASGTVSVLRNDGFGSGVFTRTQELFVAPGLQGISAGRIEADFDTDLVVSSETNGTAHVLINNGNGVFQPSLLLPIGMGAAGTALADLDNDSRDDLAVANPASSMVVVVVNLGFVPTSNPVVTQQPQINLIPGMARSGYVEGSHLTMTVAAAGNAPFFYQWFHNEDPIFPDGGRVEVNPVTGTLDLDPLALSDAGFYEVQVTDACGSGVFSQQIQLFVSGIDSDGDGVSDTLDNCPLGFNPGQENLDGDALGDACDPDIDGDGVLNGQDNCPTAANPGQQNQDGDALGDVCDSDVDGDGVANNVDNCPLVANPGQQDADMDGAGDLCDADDDNDGVPDASDNCPLASNPDQQNQDGDALGDACDPDIDGDGDLNANDNCPTTPNPAQGNIDGDSLGDACDPDIDGDGVPNAMDNCQGNFNPNQQNIDGDALGDVCDPDRDGDGVFNALDNCPNVPNPGQQDGNSNGVGDACEPDPDLDDDGVLNQNDNCPINANPAQEDADGDGVGDLCDAFPNDFDNDGVPDANDNCPMVYNPGQQDPDGDGLGDANHTYPYDEAFALGYSPALGKMFLSDINSSLYTMNIVTGTPTFVGAMSDQISGDIKGIAFIPADGETMYGIQNGFNTPTNNRLHTINPANGDILSSVQVTLAGHEVRTSNALAAHPTTNQLWAVLRTRVSPADPTLNRLVTINRTTAVATLIGNLSANFAGLAFRANGTLIGVTGDGANPSETLFSINTTTAAATLLFALGNGDDGEAIAFHPNGLLYHASGLGTGTEFFESVNLDTQVVLDLGAGCDPFPNDTDNDGVPNNSDNCPLDANPGQQDADMDGIGDACDFGPADADMDGVPDSTDNCLTTPNPLQENADGDALGDACDPDADNDGVPNASDNCPLVANPQQEDFDADGRGDACDNCGRIPNFGQQDTVGRVGCAAPDGIGDACDCDGDADKDGDVDFADITAVLTFFGTAYSCPIVPPDDGQGDADLNGMVNFADVTAVLRSFLVPCN